MTTVPPNTDINSMIASCEAAIKIANTEVARLTERLVRLQTIKMLEEANKSAQTEAKA